LPPDVAHAQLAQLNGALNPAGINPDAALVPDEAGPFQPPLTPQHSTLNATDAAEAEAMPVDHIYQFHMPGAQYIGGAAPGGLAAGFQGCGGVSGGGMGSPGAALFGGPVTRDDTLAPLRPRRRTGAPPSVSKTRRDARALELSSWKAYSRRHEGLPTEKREWGLLNYAPHGPPLGNAHV
jgi:hypothetical protein